MSVCERHRGGAVIEMGGCHLSVQRDNSKRGQNKSTAEESVYVCDCVCVCVCGGGGWIILVCGSVGSHNNKTVADHSSREKREKRALFYFVIFHSPPRSSENHLPFDPGRQTIGTVGPPPPALPACVSVCVCVCAFGCPVCVSSRPPVVRP